jgi:hypothetical protein
MKHLIDIINESDAAKYELPENYDAKVEKILTELVSKLPKFPGITNGSSGPGQNIPKDGLFHFNKWDFHRYGSAQSPTYIGCSQCLHLNIDSKHNSYDVQALRNACEVIFGAKVDEGVFDNNITKESPEYVWVSKFYDALCKFFGVSRLNNVLFEKDADHNGGVGIFKRSLSKQPTVKKEGFKFTLYNIDFSRIRENDEYSKIDILVWTYEEKDKDKLAAIKAANDTLVPHDVDGRELHVGDYVAYTIWDHKGLYKGTIASIKKDMVKINTPLVKGYLEGHATCIISRPGGKRVE